MGWLSARTLHAGLLALPTAVGAGSTPVTWGHSTPLLCCRPAPWNLGKGFTPHGPGGLLSQQGGLGGGWKHCRARAERGSRGQGKAHPHRPFCADPCVRGRYCVCSWGWLLCPPVRDRGAPAGPLGCTRPAGVAGTCSTGEGASLLPGEPLAAGSSLALGQHLPRAGHVKQG